MTTREQTAPEFDTDYEIADQLVLVLEAAGPEGVTPSTAARKARISYEDARRVLDWMVHNYFAQASGNGAWTRYHGRG